MVYQTKKVKLFSAKETGEILRVTAKTIYEMVNRGQIIPTRMGGNVKTGRTFFTMKEIEDCIKRATKSGKKKSKSPKK